MSPLFQTSANPGRSRRSASPVSSRTRASPSNDLAGKSSSKRSASVPISLAPRTAKTAPTPPPKLPAPPRKLSTPPATEVVTYTSHATILTPEAPLDSQTYLKLRQVIREAVRAQYRWDIPLDTGCGPHLPELPTGKEMVVTIEEQSEYDHAFDEGSLGRISYLQLVFTANTQRYSFHPDGEAFPFEGQGPIWDQNSCHLDVCIVAARLLNVGFTIADRGTLPRDSWLQTLPPVQQRFLDLISADWEGMDRATNIERRHSFWDDELAPLKGISKRPKFGSAVNVWDRCTSQMGQFGFEKIDGFSSCKNCGAASSSKPANHHQYLSLDMSRDQYQEHISQFGQGGMPIEYWIGREFKPLEKRCGKCRAPDGRSLSREIVGALPQRLVVVPGQYIQGLISGATNDYVQFSDWSVNGEQKATYRWLGGIYHRADHFRLYWKDGGEEFPDPRIKLYDGREGCGAIVGGIPAFSHEDKVPLVWSRGSTILFYERIDQAALDLAAERTRSHVESALADALRIESIGAQAQGIADSQQDDPRGSYAADEVAEEEEEEGGEEGKAIETEQLGAPSEEEEAGVSGSSSYGSKVLGDGDGAQPDQQEEDSLEEREGPAQDPSGRGEDQSATEDSLSSLFEDDEPDEEKDASDHDDHTLDENQDQSKEDDNDDEKEANSGGPPENSAGDHEKQRSPRPPRSPTKTPPQSPAKSPKPSESPAKTPPQSPSTSPTAPRTQSQKTGLFSGFSASRLFGLFTPLRSRTQSEPPPATASAPSPNLHQAQQNIDPFADDTPGTNLLTSSDGDISSLDAEDTPEINAVTSSDDNLSLIDADSEPEAPSAPLLPTPPTTPAKKRSRIIPSSMLGTRRSQRTFKPRSSGRMAQMIPANTRTAGSMGLYKPLPTSRMLGTAYDAGGRGRSSIRMSSMVVGQKRSSSTSSLSSTGSSAGGYGGSGGGGFGGTTKRVRFATIRG
ncbi:MAG: hypothetical protein Q9226_004157 [Calogaya cf. arnoldii]